MFTTPLGLLALLGVPAVVLLHLFQRRFQPRVVSALFLWPDRDQSSPSGRRRQRLVRTPSFWCELLAALCLGLALGGPQACGSVTAQHLVVVLDSSASMAAEPGGPGTGALFERAQEQLTKRVHALPADSRVSLVASGPRPRLLAGPAALPGEALAALDAWRPGLSTHDLGDALTLATELAGGESVLVISDHLGEASPLPNVEQLALGQPTDNLAITSALRTRNPAGEAPGETLVLGIQNFGSESRTTELTLAIVDSTGARRQELKRVVLELDAGGHTTRKLAIPPLDEALSVSLPPDALELDNHAYLVPEPKRILSVGTTFGADLRQLLGLSSAAPEDPSGAPDSGSIDRLLELIPDSVQATDQLTAHLVLGGAAAGGPRTWTLAIESPGVERRDLIGPFLKALADPIVAGMSLQGVVWSHASGFAPPGRPLISAGDTPLLTRDGNVFHLSLDPQRSTLMRSPDWPVLLANLAEARRRELPGPTRTNLHTGEDLHYRVLEPAHFHLEGPLQNAHPEALDTEARVELLLEMPAQPGLYHLERRALDAPPDAPATETTLAVNLFGGSESDLRALDAGTRQSANESAAAEAAPSWLRALLILAALVALVLDGLFLSGRRFGLPRTPEAALP